jgi:hypothetical protein
LPEYFFCPLSTLAAFLLHVTEKAGELLIASLFSLFDTAPGFRPLEAYDRVG